MIGFRLIGLFTFECSVCKERSEFELEGPMVVEFVKPTSEEHAIAALLPVHETITNAGWRPTHNPDGSENADQLQCPKCAAPAVAAAPVAP